MSWAQRPEGGHAGALRCLVQVASLLGPTVGHILAISIAGWFFLFDRSARRVSRAYLARALARPPGLIDTWRHFRSFATAVADRVFLLSGQAIAVDVEGLEPIEHLARARRGCVLLGAHLGSFEALRAVARRAPVPVRALMFRENAGALTRVLEAIEPGVRGTVIPIGQPGAMLAVRDCLAAGGMVGMLADRAPPQRAGRDEREVFVPFLGAPAAFPAGPFVVASVLEAPVFLFTAVRVAARRYKVTFEPFADPIVLRRAHRTADLRETVARFAASLELKCRQHPYEWFNFHPFWPDQPPVHGLSGVVERGLGAAG